MRRAVAGFFARAIEVREDDAALAKLRAEVEEFVGGFGGPGITDRQGVAAWRRRDASSPLFDQ